MLVALQLLSVVMSVACLALAACVVLRPVFFVQRERSQPVWCEPRQCQTTVTFRERRQFVKVVRCVLDCSLRSPGDRCSEVCMHARAWRRCS